MCDFFLRSLEPGNWVVKLVNNWPMAGIILTMDEARGLRVRWFWFTSMSQARSRAKLRKGIEWVKPDSVAVLRGPEEPECEFRYVAELEEELGKTKKAEK